MLRHSACFCLSRNVNWLLLGSPSRHSKLSPGLPGQLLATSATLVLLLHNKHTLTSLMLSGRGAVHISLLALYGVGGWLVRQGLMPVRVLLSAIGFTFSLVFATQGVVQTLADARRASASIRR